MKLAEPLSPGVLEQEPEVYPSGARLTGWTVKGPARLGAADKVAEYPMTVVLSVPDFVLLHLLWANNRSLFLALGLLLGLSPLLTIFSRKFASRETRLFEELASSEEDIKRSVGKLKQQDEFNKRIYESVAGGVILQKADGRIMHANSAASRLLGLPLEALQSETYAAEVTSFVDETHGPFSWQEYAARLLASADSALKPTMLSLGLHCFKPCQRWLYPNGAVFYSTKGEPYVVTTLNDVTEHKYAELPPGYYEKGSASGWREGFVYKLSTGEIVALYEDVTRRISDEQALWLEKERAQVTLSSIGDAVITTDTQGRITFINPVAERLTGWGQKEALGQRLPEVFSIRDERSGQVLPDPALRALKEKQIVALANHTLLLQRDGRSYAIEDSAAPILDREGNVLGAPS